MSLRFQESLPRVLGTEAEAMEAFYNSLSPVQKIFLFGAVLGGIIFVLRMILMLAGMGDHDMHDNLSDAHADADASFKLWIGRLH